MHQSVWKKAKLPKFSGLGSKAAKFDVLIVGAGITGLSAAYFLQKAGKKVAVLERGRIGVGDSGSTTAHLTSVTDLRLKDLQKSFGSKNARLVWDAGDVAINAIEAIVQQHKVDCEFRRVPGFLHSSIENRKPTPSEMKSLQDEARVAAKLGIEARFENEVPVVGLPGVAFSNQAKFHPLKYLGALAAIIQENGGSVFENTEVSEIDAEQKIVKCSKQELKYEYLVVATHVPMMGETGVVKASVFQTKLAPYSSCVVGAKLPKNLYPELSLWDTSDPYYYLRIDRGARGDYAIFGGQDYKTGQLSKIETRFEKLEKKLRTILPEAELDRRWSGQVVETHDGLPFIGQTSPNQFIATGFSGNGFTFGTLAGLMARDFVLGRKNPWLELFSPNRKEIHAGGAWTISRRT